MDEGIKSRIRTAAMTVFQKNGFKEAKILDIAKESGVTVRTIYKHYGSKKGLFDSINQPELFVFRPEFESKKHKILMKASSVFARNGYDGTSMDSIAAECNFSKALLYQYFDSKEELFQAIMSDTKITVDFSEEFRKAIQTDEDYKTVLTRIALYYLKLLSEPHRINMILMSIREPGKLPNKEISAIEKVMNQSRSGLSNYLSALREKGLITCEDTDFAARHFFDSMMSSLIVERFIRRQKKTYSKEELANKMVTMFVKGIGGK